MKETQFKKGNHPHTWRPVGSFRFSKEGYLQQKVTDTGYPPKDWRAVHNLIWEDAHGPIPPLHAVCFRDGDKSNIELENLELISRAELMRRNTVHNLPKELVEVIQIKAAIKHRITTITRKKQEKQHGEEQNSRLA
jgi:hypothetical protein